MRLAVLIALPLLALLACDSDTSDNQDDASVTTEPSDVDLGDSASGATPSEPGVVGLAGIAAWDNIAESDKIRLRAVPLLYLHQSVGQDIEDGCEANDFRFAYYGPNQDTLEPGPNGGIFADVGGVPNGEPFTKMQVVRDAFARVQGQVRVFSFSFGYADVREEDRVAVQTEYAALVADVKAAGVRFLHVTPPIVFSPEENPPKMAMREWMIATFADDDVIFDLQDLESLDLGGARCEVGGVWRICQENRSTEACPSKGQGVDGDGAGHLCEARAAEISKAFLFAYERASH